MADNTTFTPGSGATGAADDIGGVYYPRVKLSLGADGSAVDAVAGAGAVGTGVQRVTLASDDPGVALLTTIDGDTGTISTNSTTSASKLTSIAKAVEGDYETVAASQTAQVLGGAGATGDFISHILVVPATTSPGNVILLDNATSITVFAGGASSVTNLVPFVIPLNLYSVSGALKITTGANVSVVAVGSFSA